MKFKISIFILIILLLGLCSCKKEVTITSVNPLSDDNFTYYENEFDLSKIKLEIIKSDNTSHIVTLDETMLVNKPLNLTIGTNKIDIVVEGYMLNLTIIIKEKIINNLDYSYELDSHTNTYTITSYLGNEKHVVIPDKYNGLAVTRLGDEIFFRNTSVISIVLPETITEIGSACFYLCDNLDSVYIPSSVVSIGDYALDGPKVIFLGSSSINPNWSVKWYDEKISSLYYNINGSMIAHEDDYEYLIFEDHVVLTNCYLNSSIINVPNTYHDQTITEIGAHAFAFNSDVTNIFLPDTITTIGAFAFSNCSALEKITLSNTLEVIENSAFCYCSSLDNIVLPDSLTTIKDSVFNSCNSLSKLTIPRSVTSIGLYAFAWCTKMQQVYIYDTLINVSEGAFYACSKLSIYTSFSQKPATWHANWNPSNRPVTWNYDIV